MPDRRLRPVPLRGVDLRRLRRGDYSDAYFLNAARILDRMSSRAERHRGPAPALRGAAGPLPPFFPGDAEVEMQFFTRRRPLTVVSGIGHALWLIREGTMAAGGARSGRPAVRAVPEGTLTRPLEPVLTLTGRYARFAHLETVVLGVLTRSSRIATNVFETLVAARGKPILFFPARFDLPQTQAADGWAYRVAIEAYARDTGRGVPGLISTEAQGDLAGGRVVGTVPHAYILCHLGDTAEALRALCRHLPERVRRIALVDTTNDCVGESVRTARRLFDAHLMHLRSGRPALARRYVLHGVRADTAADLRDRSVPPARDPRLARGVTPILVRRIRRALDAVPDALGLRGRWRAVATRYFRSIEIVASGGFDADRIRMFERRNAPVDAYGVGSSLLRGPVTDFTADVVRARVGARLRVVAKTGRGPRSNAALRAVWLW
jgi:nicotinate phosphoribosyltransferase